MHVEHAYRQLAFRRLADTPTISQLRVWSPSNRNPCLARFLEMAN
ncbi:hypothetical protein PPMP20_26500 [Paraburkholderia phymatum]|uniref:Uncharacterized protein n=1 Tax=Paraburkholderia phymatum (strain DSM 17167 / CIP 108236 / LMG 21445 / STM815) TaxID=391038 RepID=B2JL59_PARP8|nr:hypothetical protein [Paraburkholderia phymatum]ACC72588.1 hypothetical protein Bphy_3435 [Paraburkholderia phymatum STM815]